MSRKPRREEVPQRPIGMVEMDVPGLPGVTITHSYGYDPERAVAGLASLVRDVRARRALRLAGSEPAEGGRGQAA